jgi:hypothetical protein
MKSYGEFGWRYLLGNMLERDLVGDLDEGDFLSLFGYRFLAYYLVGAVVSYCLFYVFSFTFST